jgi:uncharacterized OB-fold protein
VCDQCLEGTLTWTAVSGRGSIFAYCVFERSYYPQCPPPWPVVLVALEEGPRFVSNCPDIPIAELREGLPVRATFIACEDDAGRFLLPVFSRAGVT